MHVRAPVALSLVSILRHLPSPLRSRSKTWKGNSGTDRMMGSRWPVDLTCEAVSSVSQDDKDKKKNKKSSMW